jgi:phosphate transport system substrate-binding protein
MKMNLLNFKNTLTITCACHCHVHCLQSVSCGSGGGNASGADSTASGNDEALIGAGSSFDNPLFSKQFSEYNKTNGLKVNYQSVGSGAGISQLTSKTVDFGASDAPMNGKQDSALTAPAIHIPVTAGAVALSYNLPDVKDTLHLTPDVVAGMFLGTITNGTIRRSPPSTKASNCPLPAS